MTVLFETGNPDILDIRGLVLATKGASLQEWLSLLTSRAEYGERVGGYYRGMTITSLEEAILKARWLKTTHPNVGPGFNVYETDDIPNGVGGLEDLTLIKGVQVKLEDRRNTGFVVPVIFGVVGHPVKKSMLITKYNNDVKEATAVSICIGAPLKPPHIPATKDTVGNFVTASDALRMGYTHALIDELSSPPSRIP